MQLKLEKVEFDLQVFRGPLDLLMHLIEKNKIDIYDIPIGLLTDQYMECIADLDIISDMDASSEFLVMASTLLYLKARSLLPVEEEEEDVQETKEELVRRLLEYKMYQEISEILREKDDSTGGTYVHKQDLPKEVLAYREPVDLDNLLEGLDMPRLHHIFQMLLIRQEKKRDPVRSGFGKIRKEPIKVADRLISLRGLLKEKRRFRFSETLESHDRFEIVVTFLALLEMMKAGMAFITQDDLFGDIMIEAAAGDVQMSEEQMAEVTEY